MPKPIKTPEKFCKALKKLRKRGYTFSLHRTAVTALMPKPNNLKKYATIYWESPSSSLWCPLVVVAQVFYREGKPWCFENEACRDMGMPYLLQDEIHRACYPYEGYDASLRKMILKAVSLN